MRKLLLGLCISIFTTGFAAKSKYLSFTDGYVSQRKFEAVQKKITYGASYIDVEYKFDGAYIKQTPFEEGKDFMRLYMDDAYYITDEVVITNRSVQRLPYYKDLLVLPDTAECSSCKITILSETHSDHKCPLNKMDVKEFDNDDNFVSLKNDESKSFVPNELAKVVTKTTFRTIPLTSVNIYPILYDGSSNTLRCYSKIKYRVEFTKRTYVDEFKTRMSKLAYDILKREASNPEMLENYDLKNLNAEPTAKTCNYLIVTNDKYKVAAEKMATWKTRLGYKCHILSEDVWIGNHSGFIADSILKYCMATDNLPDYVLVIGNNNDVPSADRHIVQRISMSEDNRKTYFSDAPLARLRSTSSNGFDDMIKGRISVYTPEEAIAVVDKIISYEQNPPANSSFYDESLIISYYETEGSPKNHESKTFDFVSSAEGFHLDLKSLGYKVDRHYITCKAGQRKYTENSQPQYFLNGDKMPKDMYMEDASGNDFWDNAPSRITNLINGGKAFIIYDGHGNEGAYSFDTYTQEEVAKLKNGSKTPVFFNFTCSTGAFYYKDKDSLCFAESLLNKENGGAVGVFANSNPAVHCESKLLGTNTIENIMKLPNISVAEAVLRASMKTELGETRDIAHYFGDPSMRLNIVNPANFRVGVIRSKGDSITVNANVEGARVTVCSIADLGQSYYKTYVTGSSKNVVFKNVTVPCYITITKGGYVPYVTVSKTDLYLQNMTLNGYHNIEATNIESGKEITDEVEKGAFVVESGETKLTSSKTMRLSSGTSIKNGAKFSLRKGEINKKTHTGNGNPRTVPADICFRSLSERFTTTNIYETQGEEGPITSNEEVLSESVAVYPNPTTGLLNVEGNNINEVVVLDMTGNVLMSESVNSNIVSLDLSDYAKGMYLVKVVTENDSVVKKVVRK